MKGFVSGDRRPATGSTSITADRIYDAPRAQVFSMWTPPERVAQWWGPEGFRNTIDEMDVRPGGVWRFVMHGPDGVDYQNRSCGESNASMTMPAHRASAPVFGLRSSSHERLCFRRPETGDRRPATEDRRPATAATSKLVATATPVYRYLRYVPKNHLSRFIGRLVHARLPAPVARRLVKTFANAYEIDVDAAGDPLHSYPSIGHFFIRDLREGLRPIEGDFVSPVDGTLRNFGIVENGRLEQIKGKTYTVARFLGDDEHARRYEGGAYFNLYLSPQDYHHVHSPVSGRIGRSVHIPGKLWPVNDWSLENVDELFSINERVVTYVDCPLGRVAVVMIGATNVGKISVAFDTFLSNTATVDRTVHRDYEPPIAIEAGARLGTFHMGSSVVILIEPGRVDLARVRLERGKKVQYGAAILHGE